MVALRDEHHVAAVAHEGLVEGAVVSVDSLDLEADFPRAESFRDASVHVLNVDMLYLVCGILSDREGVAAPDDEVPGVQTETRVATVEKVPELLVALDYGSVVRVQHGR